MTLPPLPSRSSERHIFPTLPNALHARIPVLLAFLSAAIADVTRNVNVVVEILTLRICRVGALSFVVALLLCALPPDAHTEIIIILLLVKFPPQRKLSLAKNLEFAEQSETDRGYRGSAPAKVRCPGGLLEDPNDDAKAMSARVRSRQETVNERFKNWGILNTPYCHNIFKHQTVFGAIVCLTQLSLKFNPLFSVEYND